MLRNIDDYRDMGVGIHCSNKEEWVAILELLGYPLGHATYDSYGEKSIKDGIYDAVGIYSGDIRGWGPISWFKTIYPASDFLEGVNYEIY